MSVNQTIRLLLLNDSRSEAERLISMLHNAGMSTRAQHVESPEALNKLLKEQAWDLMIALDTTQNIAPVEALKHIKRLSRDVPVILLTDEEGTQPIIDGLKLGVMDVVRLDEDQHLLLTIQRELNNHEQRDLRRKAERRYKETERRNQQLLDSSRDAIAFIQDGMFLYANDSFAELLGYDDRDELECMPIIDTVDEGHQEQVKKFLKEFTLKGSDVETTQLSFDALTCDGNPKPLKVAVRKSNYDNETCIQFVIRTSTGDSEELEAQILQIKNQDLTTGLFNKSYLLEQLEVIVDTSLEQKQTSALFLIGINQFLETVQTKLGASASDLVLGSIANQAKTLTQDMGTLYRYGEDTFVLLIQSIDTDAVATHAEELAQHLTNYIVDINGSTLQFNYNIGVALISETYSEGETTIDQALQALELARKASTDNEEQRVAIYEPEIQEDAKASKDIAKMVQEALDKNQFRLLFQPILSLRGSDQEHYEVLLRMLDDEGQDISPNDFLSTAATIGATTKIDRWVILESIKVLSNHQAEGNNTRLIINLSRESLCDTTLAPWLGVAFKAASLKPESVIFQFQELHINDHLTSASTITQQISELGCGCSVSHFGCALNPFNALSHIQAEYIKVDGSFTEELQAGTAETEALSELVSKLHQEDKITIIPFVENASVLSKLWQSGVHYIQGFYLQGPSENMDYDFDMET